MPPNHESRGNRTFAELVWASSEYVTQTTIWSLRDIGVGAATRPSSDRTSEMAVSHYAEQPPQAGKSFRSTAVIATTEEGMFE